MVDNTRVRTIVLQFLISKLSCAIIYLQLTVAGMDYYFVSRSLNTKRVCAEPQGPEWIDPALYRFY